MPQAPAASSCRSRSRPMSGGTITVVLMDGSVRVTSVEYRLSSSCRLEAANMARRMPKVPSVSRYVSIDASPAGAVQADLLSAVSVVKMCAWQSIVASHGRRSLMARACGRAMLKATAVPSDSTSRNAGDEPMPPPLRRVIGEAEGEERDASKYRDRKIRAAAGELRFALPRVWTSGSFSLLAPSQVRARG